MKQFDLFKTEDELFIEESESFIFELEKHIDKLEAQEKFVEENNGFDWAKEFPQLCDDKGNWQGFDAIVGNPPYIDIRNIKEHYKSFYNIFYKEQKNNFDLYSLFIQRALSLLKSEGVLSFIVPKPILYNSTFKPIRKIIFENTLNQIYVPDKLVFDKVFVETVILFIEKKKTPNNEFIINRQDVGSRMNFVEKILFL